MKRAAVPKALQAQLGDEATDGLVELFNRQQAQMTDDIVRAVVRALEPRFAAIEARLDNCATKDDLHAFATKDDLHAFATKDDLRAFATKDDLRAFATKDDLRAFATKDDLRAFATKDDLRAFATKDDLRAFATKDDLRAFATKEDLREMPDHPAFRKFATKDDLRAFATKDDFRATFATKEEFSILRVEMAEGFGRLRGDMAAQHAEMMKWMFVFWVGQAFVVLAYFRIGQYVAR